MVNSRDTFLAYSLVLNPSLVSAKSHALVKKLPVHIQHPAHLAFPHLGERGSEAMSSWVVF